MHKFLNQNFYTHPSLNHKYRWFSSLIIMGFIFLVGSFFADLAVAVTVAELQAPIEALKSEIFGGWMMVVKICAATAGIVMSAFRSSLAPFGIGAGLAAGIHLYDAYLGTGAAGALI